jgi:hypothetical protein
MNEPVLQTPKTFDKIFAHIEIFYDVKVMFVKSHSEVGMYGHNGSLIN